MMYKITTPDDITIEVDTSVDDTYLKDIQSRGYKVEPASSLDDFFAEVKPTIRIHRTLEECEACSA